ncbi:MULTISPECIES: ATP-binding cassette domain-containing protein [Vagococcus]|uniref:ABC transporter ATP-binding protein n=1 Tax=Vagococcus fluvialis bH819 TaxID=1255619 RepID=A0A1X6WNA3_9ENTE|nr:MULTISPECIES: ATP-binding cassette domain-containing protein [Vagococcus]SLM85811.1 ABC transporter ATP-binding protein [Vagococcus fluvialis bH819]HCM90233.1 ABC transporter ATP-binding protein [Vagococcus sp.]
MRSPILTIKDGIKVTDSGMRIMDQLNLEINQGDFITILGGNGAGKSTLFNSISGNLFLTSGEIIINETVITQLSEEKRAKFIGRVFQDPKLGTAPRMTVSENLLIASLRGKKRGFSLRKLANKEILFHDLCKTIGNGLENHLDTPTGDLSGGQRQALSLLMSTLQKPTLLLLDEHTAALDPKTAKHLMTLTNNIIEENHLTCLMITHRMEDALKYGNRLLVLEQGKIKKDFNQQEKEKLTMSDVLSFF